jgi:hypothetical protein
VRVLVQRGTEPVDEGHGPGACLGTGTHAAAQVVLDRTGIWGQVSLCSTGAARQVLQSDLLGELRTTVVAPWCGRPISAGRRLHPVFGVRAGEQSGGCPRGCQHILALRKHHILVDIREREPD